MTILVIYEVIIFAVVKLGLSQRLRAYENSVQKRIFGPKRAEVRGQNKQNIFHSVTLTCCWSQIQLS
jgi:hypothetical protein